MGSFSVEVGSVSSVSSMDSVHPLRPSRFQKRPSERVFKRGRPPGNNPLEEGTYQRIGTSTLWFETFQFKCTLRSGHFQFQPAVATSEQQVLTTPNTKKHLQCRLRSTTDSAIRFLLHPLLGCASLSARDSARIHFPQIIPSKHIPHMFATHWTPKQTQDKYYMIYIYI